MEWKYDAEDLKSIKGKIVAAWKEKIDKDGPPSAEKTVGRESEAHPATLNKGPTAFPEEEGTMLG
ncbi:MAG: hypothetical protein ABSF44_16530 [Candidatus Bathyarchaeia archaeon]|jgi:hypothetical protein